MNVKANWVLRLDCSCPTCNGIIDLTVGDSVWSRGIEACEHGTPRTKNITVFCPNCCKDFLTDLEY